MGHRVLKRVPLDFDAPLKEVWVGYINPHRGPSNCSACDGSGYNPATKKISDDWYSFDRSRWVWIEPGVRRYNDLAWSHHLTQDEVEALVRRGRFVYTGLLKETSFIADPDRKTSNYSFDEESGEWLDWDSNERVEVNEPEYPSAEDVNAWSTVGFGHDAINQWICVKVRAKRLGVYGKCPVCKGDGEIKNPDEKEQRLYDEWEEYEPPEGEGYQLGETVSEGSPVSPVLGSAEGLAEWCEENATVFGNEKMPKADWMRMFGSEDKGEVGSLMMSDGKGYFGPALNAPGADD